MSDKYIWKDSLGEDHLFSREPWCHPTTWGNRRPGIFIAARSISPGWHCEAIYIDDTDNFAVQLSDDAIGRLETARTELSADEIHYLYFDGTEADRNCIRDRLIKALKPCLRPSR